MTDQTPVCDVREKHVKLIAGSIHAHVNANEHISFAVLIAAEDALLELRRQLTEAQATIERLTKELEADIVTMAEAGQNLQAQRIELRVLQSDAAIGKAAQRDRELALVKAATDPAYGFNGIHHGRIRYEEFLDLFDRSFIASYLHEGGK